MVVGRFGSWTFWVGGRVIHIDQISSGIAFKFWILLARSGAPIVHPAAVMTVNARTQQRRIMVINLSVHKKCLIHYL
jgi:hypothetical protein